MCAFLSVGKDFTGFM